MLNWNTKVKASMEESLDGVERVILKGVLIDNTVNENSWQILAEDLPDIAAQSVGIQLRLDHSEEVEKVKGKILFAEVDQPHDEDKADWDPAIDVPHIHFEAELITNDQDILIPVMHGYVDHVSIGADAENVYCSECGKPTRPFKICKCASHDILHGITVKEYSIITNPAYKNASFVPFTAAVSKHLKELEGDKLETPEEKSEITITSGVTNIYNSPDKTEVIAEKISDAETEDVVEVEASAEKVSVIADAEPEEETPVEAGIKEDEVSKNSDKPNNINRDIQKGPGISELESMEVDKMPEDNKDKKEEEVEAGTTEGPGYEAEDIGGLTSAVKDLVALLTQMKTEASEEEDDDKEKVQANDGNLTEDHDQKSGNPPKGDGAAPAAPKSYAEPEAPKTDVLPVKTPAMSASKGTSAGLVGAEGKQMDNETASLDEVMAFAATRGTLPRSR